MFYIVLALFFFVLFDGMIVSVFSSGSYFEPMLTTMGLIILANYFTEKKLLILTIIFATLFSMMFTTMWLVSAVNIISVVFICYYIANIWTSNLLMTTIQCIIGISILLISSYFAVIIAGVVNITFIEFFIKYLTPTLVVNVLLLPIVYLIISRTATNYIESGTSKKYR